MSDDRTERKVEEEREGRGNKQEEKQRGRAKRTQHTTDTDTDTQMAKEGERGVGGERGSVRCPNSGRVVYFLPPFLRRHWSAKLANCSCVHAVCKKGCNNNCSADARRSGEICRHCAKK